MRQLFWAALAVLSLLVAECAESVQTPLEQCLAHFPSRPDWPDTLHCFLPDTPEGTPVPDTVLRAVLDSAQFENLHFGTGDAHFWALGQFPFADGLRAVCLRTEEFWFGKQSLLIFDIRQQKCLTVVELSHFYGGDGGQTASEAWLFRSKVPPQLFVKSAEHGFRVAEVETEEPQEYLQEYGQLFQWGGQQFQSLPNPDSLLFLRQYPMHRTW